MSKIQVDTIDTRSGTATMTIGSTNTSTIALKSGATLTNFPANTPAFQANAGSTDQSIAHNTWTKLTLGTEDFDSDSAFASSKFTVPAGEGGKYMFGYGTALNNLDDGEKLQIILYKNGSNDNSTQNRVIGSTNNQLYYVQGTQVLVLSASDYIELYMMHEEGGSQDTNSAHVFLYGYKLIGV